MFVGGRVAKQQRFLPPDVKRRYGVCRGRLRHLLGAMLEIAQPPYNSSTTPTVNLDWRNSIEHRSNSMCRTLAIGALRVCARYADRSRYRAVSTQNKF